MKGAPPANARGFSLVETSIALGIAAVATVGLIALLATTLRMSGETADRFSTARIFQAIGHEAQMKEWPEILAIPLDKPEVSYFDEKGAAVEPGSREAIYAARVTYRNSLELNGKNDPSPATPGKGDSRRVFIEVSPRALDTDPFKDRLAVRRITILLTRLDK